MKHAEHMNKTDRAELAVAERKIKKARADRNRIWKRIRMRGLRALAKLKGEV
jgi:hypothetical protein